MSILSNSLGLNKEEVDEVQALKILFSKFFEQNESIKHVYEH